MTDVRRPPVGRSGLAMAARFAELTAICTIHLFRFGAHALAFWSREALPDRAARQTARLLEDLGPTFVKIGQALSARPDVTAPALCAALSRLQEHVRAEPWPAMQVVLRDAFTVPDFSLFASIDPVPVAAGSMAQVHRGVLRDGRIVAVKIRRPGVTRRVTADFALLRALASCIAILPGTASMPIRELIEEFAGPVCDQLDFTREARNHRRFRTLFAHTERVIIPALIDELCTDSVLTMEFVDGLRSLTSEPLTLSERRDVALLGLRALYTMIFNAGLVHADLHPGNVFAGQWGSVVLLDAGLVAELSDRDRRAFVDFFFGLVADRGEECAQIVIDGAAKFGRRFDAAAFRNAMAALISRHAHKRSREFDIAAFVGELIGLQRQFQVRGSTAFMTTILAMVLYDGICKQLYPECNFQAEARGFLTVARYGFQGS